MLVIIYILFKHTLYIKNQNIELRRAKIIGLGLYTKELTGCSTEKSIGKYKEGWKLSNLIIFEVR